MNHLSEEQLYAYVVDKIELALDAISHLSDCAACQQQIEHLQALQREFHVANYSQPSSAAKQRYYQCFEQIEQQSSSLIDEVVNWLRAELTWDSRHQLAADGVRNVDVNEYRQLYTTSQGEIELMISPQGTIRQLDGDIVLVEGDVGTNTGINNTGAMPALIQLAHLDYEDIIYEAESTDEGRFQLTKVKPGRYTILIAPIIGVPMIIDELEII